MTKKKMMMMETDTSLASLFYLQMYVALKYGLSHAGWKKSCLVVNFLLMAAVAWACV